MSKISDRFTAAQIGQHELERQFDVFQDNLNAWAKENDITIIGEATMEAENNVHTVSLMVLGDHDLEALTAKFNMESNLSMVKVKLIKPEIKLASCT